MIAWTEAAASGSRQWNKSLGGGIRNGQSSLEIQNELTLLYYNSWIIANKNWIVKNYFFNNPFLRHSSIQKPRLDKWNFAEDLSRSWRRIENRGRDNATIRSVSGKGKKWKLLRTCSRECRYIKPRFSRIRKETGGNFETSWIFVLENETMEEIEKSG